MGCCDSGTTVICCSDINDNGLCDNDTSLTFCNNCPDNWITAVESFDDYGCLDPNALNYNESATLDICGDGITVCSSDSDCSTLNAEHQQCNNSCNYSDLSIGIYSSNVSSFGISSNTYRFTPTGGDSRKTFTIPLTVDYPESCYISYIDYPDLLITYINTMSNICKESYRDTGVCVDTVITFNDETALCKLYGEV